MSNYKLITIANSARMAVLSISDILIRVNNLEILIQNVNYILNLKIILISFRELIEKNWEINFIKSGAIINHKYFDGKVKVNWENNAYFL